MNKVIFTKRLQKCRKLKFSSQQKFADAYMKKYGLLRQGKKDKDNNMFGTIQAWEQGKTVPTAEALANICELLDCDSDYLLGRINERTHDIQDAKRFTGLSTQALEQLHEYNVALSSEPEWTEIVNLEENWRSHNYYKAYALYLIDELLTGSEHHKLDATALDKLFTKIKEDSISVHPEDYESPDENDRELFAAQDQELVDIATFRITNNIRDILVENAIQNKFPPALHVATSHGPYEGAYYFSVKN